MSQPIRVEEWAYPRGARVSLRLRFRSHNSYARLKAKFHNPSGGGHQARGSFASKGGIRGGSHRGRPYGQLTRKRGPWHLRMHIRGGAYWRQEVGGGGRPFSKTPPSTSA